MASNNSGEGAETVEIAELNAVKSITNDEEIVEKGNDSSDEKREKARHHFSEPWEDSDVILVVENENFHVHRLILSMNSPVFKAMFKSQFKEATANEIPLPGKNVKGVLDFLMKIYGPQYTKKEVEFTMENVEQLMQLSDEYQVTEHIFQPCVEFLEDEPKTKENVVKIRALAEFYDLEKVRQDCDILLKGMTLGTLSKTVQFENVEKDKLQHFLTQRIEVLEGYLEKLYPQFMGLLEGCLRLFHEDRQYLLQWCPIHFSSGKVKARIKLDECIKGCKTCQEMLGRLASNISLNFNAGNSFVFQKNECLPSIIQRYSQVMAL